MWHYTGTHTYKCHKHMDTKNKNKTLVQATVFSAWNRTSACSAEQRITVSMIMESYAMKYHLLPVSQPDLGILESLNCLIFLPVAIPVQPSGGHNLCHHRGKWPEGATIGHTAPLTSLPLLRIGMSLHAPSFPLHKHLSTGAHTQNLLEEMYVKSIFSQF